MGKTIFLPRQSETPMSQALSSYSGVPSNIFCLIWDINQAVSVRYTQIADRYSKFRTCNTHDATKTISQASMYNMMGVNSLGYPKKRGIRAQYITFRPKFGTNCDNARSNQAASSVALTSPKYSVDHRTNLHDPNGHTGCKRRPN
jgi:hypothetical protein